jgi:hypothetical protein
MLKKPTKRGETGEFIDGCLPSYKVYWRFASIGLHVLPIGAALETSNVRTLQSQILRTGDCEGLAGDWRLSQYAI